MGVTTISLPHDIEAILRKRAKNKYGSERFIGKVIVDLVQEHLRRERIIKLLDKFSIDTDYDPNGFNRSSAWSRR